MTRPHFDCESHISVHQLSSFSSWPCTRTNFPCPAKSGRLASLYQASRLATFGTMLLISKEKLPIFALHRQYTRVKQTKPVKEAFSVHTWIYYCVRNHDLLKYMYRINFMSFERIRNHSISSFLFRIFMQDSVVLAC